MGVTARTTPLPFKVPPQETVYHFQPAPVPSVPPVSTRVTAVPEHIVEDGFAVMEVAVVDKVLTVIAALAQVEVLQLPSALT